MRERKEKCKIRDHTRHKEWKKRNKNDNEKSTFHYMATSCPVCPIFATELNHNNKSQCCH